MRRGGGWVAALALLATSLLFTSAQAATTTAHFTTHDNLLLPKTTNATLNSEVLFLPDTASLQNLSLYTEKATVCAITLGLASVSLPVAGAHRVVYDTNGGCFPLSDVQLRLVVGEQTGWLGFRPDPAGHALFNPTESHQMAFRDHSRFASPANDSLSSNSRDTPQNFNFVHEVNGPHLFSEAPGFLTYSGAGELKVQGPDVQVVAAENTTTYRTGEQWDSTTGMGTISWIVVQFDKADVTIGSPYAPFQVASREVRASVDGVIQFTAASGFIDVAGITHQASQGEQVRVDGQLEAALLPAPRGGGIDLTLSGDVQDVALGSMRISPPGSMNGDSPFPWLAFGLGVLTVVASGVAGTVLVRSRRRAGGPSRRRRLRAPGWVGRWRGEPAPRHTLEECLQFAAWADEADAFERAIHWYAQARKLAPHRVDIVLDQADLMRYLGDHEGAVGTYEEAAIIADDGRPDFEAARTLAGLKRFAEAEVFLVRALEKSPEFVLVVQEDSESFEAMIGRPGFEKMLDEATLRLAGDRPGRARR